MQHPVSLYMFVLLTWLTFSSRQYSGRTNLGPSGAEPPLDVDIPRLQSALCARCHSVVGLLESREQSVRLFKWQLDCRTLRSVEAPTAIDCLSSALIATVSRSGSAKVMILPISAGDVPEASEEALYLWILNPGITYTSTEATGGVKTAIKLFYQNISRSEADNLLNPVTSDIQDLALAEEALKESVRHLEATNKLLPEEQRRHQDWKVGLLARYQNDR